MLVCNVYSLKRFFLNSSNSKNSLCAPQIVFRWPNFAERWADGCGVENVRKICPFRWNDVAHDRGGVEFCKF